MSVRLILCLFYLLSLSLSSLAQSIRHTKAAILIQTHYRMYYALKRYQTLRRSTILLQCLVRGRQALRSAAQLRRERASVCIQARVRGWLCRCAAKRRTRMIVMVECCVRRWLARRQLRALKVSHASVTVINSTIVTVFTRIQ